MRQVLIIGLPLSLALNLTLSVSLRIAVAAVAAYVILAGLLLDPMHRVTQNPGINPTWF